MMRQQYESALLAGTWVSVLLLLCAPFVAYADDVEEITNFRQYSPLLASSGQPSRSQFEVLRDAGFERIVFLAPYDSHGSFAEEAQIVPGLGIEYVHVPVDWDRPTASDFEMVAAAIDADPDKKTLLHCQVNFRASSISFLYRVIRQGVPVASAKEDLDSVWVPNDTWRRYIFTILDGEGISADCDTCIWDD